MRPDVCETCHLILCKCAEPATVECDALEGEDRTPEVVEADVRRTMAEHAAIDPRGWQTERQRTILHQRVDRLLDEYAALLEIEAMTA